jgi:hypothetical protein
VKQQLDSSSDLFIYVLQSYKNVKTEIPVPLLGSILGKKTDFERENGNSMCGVEIWSLGEYGKVEHSELGAS